MATDNVLSLVAEKKLRGKKSTESELFLGWGYKRSGNKAIELAYGKNSCAYRVEEGFYSYLHAGSKPNWRVSYIFDNSGMYYNSHQLSDLEILLNSGYLPSQALLDRAHQAMALIRKEGLTKYPSLGNVSEELRSFSARFDKIILIVDQTNGDKSVELGLASESSFENMFTDALAESHNGDVGIVVKTHPDVVRGDKQGYLTHSVNNSHVFLISESVNPYVLFDEADEVWTVTSQLGFEALIAGKPVRCFGMPFYAGWGLTKDELTCERRTVNKTLKELFVAACIQYPVYVDPFKREICELEDVLQLQIQRKRITQRYGQYSHAICFGFSLWKRALLKVFLAPLFKQVTFVKSLKAAKKKLNDNAVIISWGQKALNLKSQEPDLPLLCLEDGFIRSSGLGSDLKRPSSLSLDSRGLHFASNIGSDLQHFLASHTFTLEERQRAKDLIDKLIDNGISKYNLASSQSKISWDASGRTVILVPGQVAGDASLIFGSPIVRNNRELLELVRRENPEAFVVYKPHPDVVSGNRKDPDLDYKDCPLADLVIDDQDILDCIKYSDEVHTMTSQTGFEALLRNKKVVCYGHPFYSGWGLTEDKQSSSTNRQLALEELVYGALIWYPLYFDWELREFCSAENVIESLKFGEEKNETKQRLEQFRFFTRTLLKGKYLLESFISK